MNATRRLSIAALVVACTHLVFGAIVRISGSGMGCGDNWPKCYGSWFPPFSRPDLIVEVSHRYLASILTITVLSMAFVAWRHRGETGIGGRGGALRSAFGAVGAVFAAAILGGVTVKMGNAPWATVAHWCVAMTLLAMVATTAIRTGALGGASALVQRGSMRARRSGLIAAGLAIFAVALGGLTAKYPGASVGCTTVPMCGPNPNVEPAGVQVQLIHRTLAVLLVLHLIGMAMLMRKRRDEEASVVVRATYVALAMVLLQLVVASSMILFHLPPVLRSLHEATGVGIWLSCFVLAYLARRASEIRPDSPAVRVSPAPVAPPAVPSGPAPAPSRSDRHEEPGSKPATPAIIHATPVVETSLAEVAVADVAVSEPIVDEPPASEELDWEPRRAQVAEELDEFSIAALEAEVAQLEAAAEAEVQTPTPAPQEISAAPAMPVEQVTGDASVVAPPVQAPKLSPLPAPTMAVLVARGADLL